MKEVKEIKNLKDLREIDYLEVERDLRLERVKNHNMEVIQKSLYDILYLVEGLSQEVCKMNGNIDLMDFFEEEVYKINCKIKEINTDATL